MKFLLDTHVLIWMDSQPTKLSSGSAEAIRDEANEILLSGVSLWEIQIKMQLGKLSLSMPLVQVVADQQRNGVRVLRIEPEHVYALERLPMKHTDPFDRLLIAQAASVGARIISQDAAFKQYAVQVVW